MDIQKLLRSLLDNNVTFLVVGAWAMPAYGYTRMTQDIDIFIRPTAENAKNTVKALKLVGYDVVADIKPEIFLSKKVLLREYMLRTDIHPFVAGTNFDEAWKNRMETEIKGNLVCVPSLDDMIRMKEAAGRDQDKIDLKVLKEIQQQNKKLKK